MEITLGNNEPMLLTRGAASKNLLDCEDKLDIVTLSEPVSITAELGKYYSISTAVGTLAITLPTVTGATKVEGIVFCFTTGSSPAITFSAGEGVTISYYADYVIEAQKSYEINAIWNGTKWILAYGVLG